MALKQYNGLMKDLQTEIENFDIHVNQLEELYHEAKQLDKDDDTTAFETDELIPLYEDLENDTEAVMNQLRKTQQNIDEMQMDFLDMEDEFGALSNTGIIAVRNKIHNQFAKYKKLVLKVKRLKRFIDDTIRLPFTNYKEHLKTKGKENFISNKEYARQKKKHKSKKQVKIRDPQYYARLKAKKFDDDTEFDPQGIDIDKLTKLYRKLSKEQQEAFKKLGKLGTIAPEQKKVSDTLKALLQKRIKAEGGKGNFLDLLGNGKYRKNRRNRKRKHR